jgi:hypothetical protein
MISRAARREWRGAEPGADRAEREQGVRPGQRQRDRVLCGQREHVSPGRRGGLVAGQRRVQRLHLRRRIERKRIRVSAIDIARGCGPDRSGGDALDGSIAEQVGDGHEAARGDRLAEMRVVEHDQVVAPGELRDRRRLEALERLRVPADLELAGPALRRGHERRTAARMIPGQAAECRHSGSSAMTPRPIRSSTSRPS